MLWPFVFVGVRRAASTHTDTPPPLRAPPGQIANRVGDGAHFLAPASGALNSGWVVNYAALARNSVVEEHASPF
jgi:hypothetical protein